MSITTYQELQDNLAGWLNRTDLTAIIPTFIQLAEARFNRHAAVSYDRRDTITLNAATVALPVDCKEVRELYFDDATRRAVIEIRSAGEIDPTLTGPLTASVPRYAAISSNGSGLILAPAPASSLTAWIVYLTKLTPLSAAAPVNWLLTDHPDLYLFGSLVEAEPYLKNDERMGFWQGRMDQGLQELEDLIERRKYSGNTPVLRARLAIG